MSEACLKECVHNRSSNFTKVSISIRRLRRSQHVARRRRDLAGQPLETRRAIAPEQETFEALTAAVESLFGIDAGTYALEWTDEDGDTIVVNSDTEVMAARKVSRCVGK